MRLVDGEASGVGGAFGCMFFVGGRVEGSRGEDVEISSGE